LAGRSSTTDGTPPVTAGSAGVSLTQPGSTAMPGPAVHACTAPSNSNRNAASVDTAVTGGVPSVVLDLPASAMAEFNTFAASCYQQDERCPVGQVVVTLGADVVSIASVAVPEFEGSLQLAMADEATVLLVTEALAG
jgi:hypothetical protein